MSLKIILRISFWVEFSPARGSGMWERCIASSTQKSVQHWGTPWVNKADTPRQSGGVLVHQNYGDLRACLPAHPSGGCSKPHFFSVYQEWEAERG